MDMRTIQFKGYIPGAIGRVAEMHALYYSQNWGFDLYFEAKVASEVAAFLNRIDPDRDLFCTVCHHERVEGCIAIDGVNRHQEGAHLRWFIVSSAIRGQGWGNRLLQEALSFCREKHYRRIYLWTFEGLETARHLYEKYGFQLAEQKEGARWGSRVAEQKFILEL